MAVTLRNPTFSPVRSDIAFESPSISWLTETWHVTHSTLPMWKSKRNVRITYTPLAPSSPDIPAEHTDRLDDLVTYQGLDSEKVSSVRGVDSAATRTSGNGRGEWDWRGKGWLKIASSHWEVLGWGREGGRAGQEGDGEGNKWVVTMFAKTLFTPAGIDVYSRDATGLREETLREIKDALAASRDEGVKEMAKTLFEVKIDSVGE